MATPAGHVVAGMYQVDGGSHRCRHRTSHPFVSDFERPPWPAGNQRILLYWLILNFLDLLCRPIAHPVRKLQDLLWDQAVVVGMAVRVYDPVAVWRHYGPLGGIRHRKEEA
jgi:hypothetical protein